MKILVTGANGFIGKNLVLRLKNRGYDVYECDVDTAKDRMDFYCAECDFVFHLAGVNRPTDEAQFNSGNVGSLQNLIGLLEKNGNAPPILLSSSVQAERDNPYGRSKKAAEELLDDYGRKTASPVFSYRLFGVFGKWCRPNYNSVVATFCHNIANDIPITINDADAVLEICYIDDVVDAFINTADTLSKTEIEPIYRLCVGELAERITMLAENRGRLILPSSGDSFEKKLYATYLSHLPNNELIVPLKMNVDDRGSFTELFKTAERGQVSVNVTKPGIVKGNHWHDTKNEKFAVVAGTGIIRLKSLDGGEIAEYRVSGDKLEVVDIPPGYAHNIENTGMCDLVTIMWANECFDPKNPDTYQLTINS